MITKKYLIFLIVIFFSYSVTIKGEDMILYDFSNQERHNDDLSWRFFTDGVMGGLSRGKVKKDNIHGIQCYKMSGDVTTENNGGFIQIRLDLNPKIEINKYEGLYLKIYGNNQKYFLHIRTGLTLAPWQYYSHSFIANNKWTTIKTNLKDFKRSNFYQPKKLNNQKIKTIGLVAGFDNYKADICLAEIGLF